MKNLNTVELRLNATEQVLDRKDLSIDPSMQMRVEMNHTTVCEYADDIEKILDEHPLSVVEIEEATGPRWLVVDGFHRYHAAVQADVTAIPVSLMKGTYEDAQVFAMSSNWQHGNRPQGKDAKRSIEMLLEYAPDFEYNSKAVTNFLTSCGIPRSTANKHTVELRSDIDAKRDAKILELLDQGATEKLIKDEVSCGASTIHAVKKSSAPNCSVSETEQDETSDTESSPFPADEPFFNEEELDATPALNPADAFQKALSEHEEERTHQQQDKTDVSIASSDVEDVLDAVVKLCAYQSDTVIEATLKKCELKRSAIKRLANLV